MNSPCVIIPVYNHEGAIASVIERLKQYRLPCLLMDDGSSEACKLELQRLAAKESSWLKLLRFEVNQGKGAAVMAGCRQLLDQGYSHALQIDADGQHDTGDLPRFLEASEKYPEALILGSPHFDGSAPRLRRIGHSIGRFWIWTNSLSMQAEDAMCGYRIYPLEPFVRLSERCRLGRRMDFDPDVLVRLSWEGISVVNIRTAVHYPIDGRSHFRMLRDNWLISRMHARLFFGMLARFPLLLRKKWAKTATGRVSLKSDQPGA
jgi:glycosyltransferase involved in cell wall biosynthesis